MQTIRDEILLAQGPAVSFRSFKHGKRSHKHISEAEYTTATQSLQQDGFGRLIEFSVARARAKCKVFTKSKPNPWPAISAVNWTLISIMLSLKPYTVTFLLPWGLIYKVIIIFHHKFPTNLWCQWSKVERVWKPTLYILKLIACILNLLNPHNIAFNICACVSQHWIWKFAVIYMEFITIDVSCLLSANKPLTDSINDSYSFDSTASKRNFGGITLTRLIIFFFHCGSAGLREQSFYPHFIFVHFPLRECRTAGAVVLPSFHIRAVSTAGLREQAFNVTQSWPGILKSLLLGVVHFRVVHLGSPLG